MPTDAIVIERPDAHERLVTAHALSSRHGELSLEVRRRRLCGMEEKEDFQELAEWSWLERARDLDADDEVTNQYLAELERRESEESHSHA